MLQASINSLILKTPAASHWKKIGIKTHNGIVIYIPALRTQQNSGIGEYLDLIPMIDWAATVGFDVIQLLPINDGGSDPSPYNSLSAFALNPALLSLTPLVGGKQSNIIKALEKYKQNKRVPYEKVYAQKDALFRDLYINELPRLKKDRQYEQFIDENPWLQTYTHFRAMKMLSNKSWMTWNSAYIHRNHKVNEYIENESGYYCFLQYLCHLQMKHVKQYAEQKGVFIKGDIPILVAPDSADVWGHTDLFNLNLSAGAPPDQYSADGQYWGFPIFLWQNQYAKIMEWWIQRLKYAANYYHLYRLDHVVGLFRIWAIHLDKSAREGTFIPSDETLWIPTGKKILQTFLNECPMLPIAEDLGSVPDSVRKCLTELGIPGTKVMRWERKQNGFYINAEDYPPISMTTLSTHDSEISAEWWLKYPEDAIPYAKQQGWNYQKILSGVRESEMLSKSYHTSSLFHINLLQEVLRLDKKISWKNPQDDRINIPGVINNRNWRYKYCASVEKITQSTTLRKMIEKILH